ncbi:hypothetical protein [Peribacillus loiseleuriae]|uniref:Uncharacterized protein n=1 Tax=Peribacillus loiseleuriae TaxID=1679170 RepID=A0A0K9GTN6_9BACI|nr:hypothetical protein [Peribacillus loiseleuriae]KMY49637.1 hypothetical protein AC625_08875 [Peribacillus loiseleuriae]
MEKTEPNKTKNLKEYLIFDECNAMFKQDPEETQYPNGKYQLKGGAMVNAASFNYEASDVFDYATVIFYEGKLAHLQLDTESSVEDIEKRLSISFHTAIVEPYKFGSGYEVIFNETFADENIAILPNERDELKVVK